MDDFTKAGLPAANDDPGLRGRIRASKPLARSPLRDVGALVEFAGMTLDVDGHHLVGPDGRDVPLTMGELELLLVLLEQPGAVASRDHLMRRLHGRPTQPGDRAVDVQVGRLRCKLEPERGHPTVIKSIRGVGYLLAVPARRR